MSSNCVVSVMYEPLADELRLWGGDGRLSKLSEPVAPSALEIRLLSPVPFSRLGDAPRLDAAPADARERRPYPELLALSFFVPLSELLYLAESRLLEDGRCAPLMSDVVVDADKGLGGRLFTLEIFGGAGNVPMLVVLRKVLPEVAIADDGGEGDFELEKPVVLSVGTAGVDADFVGLGVGSPDVVTDRLSGLLSATAVEAEPACASVVSETSGSGFLVRVIGKAGRGPEGGAYGGGAREGRCGMVEVIVAVAVRDIAVFLTKDPPSAATVRYESQVYGQSLETSVLIIASKLKLLQDPGLLRKGDKKLLWLFNAFHGKARRLRNGLGLNPDPGRTGGIALFHLSVLDKARCSNVFRYANSGQRARSWSRLVVYEGLVSSEETHEEWCTRPCAISGMHEMVVVCEPVEGILFFQIAPTSLERSLGAPSAFLLQKHLLERYRHEFGVDAPQRWRAGLSF